MNERGLRDAPRMGKRFKEKAITPDKLITSPANRALTTCTLFAETIEFPKQNIKTEERLYHADEEEILDIVQNLKEPGDAVILVGHNPGFTVPTCGIVACKLPVKEWKDVSWQSGQLLFFDFPKNTD